MIRDSYQAAWLALIVLLPFASAAPATDFSEAFERVDPAVVVLHTFAAAPAPQGEAQTVTQRGLGSGVVISKDGKVVTAAHVAHSADAVHVEFRDGTKRLARVINSVPAADLSLLQIESAPDDLPFAELGDSSAIKVGQEVFAIGAPYGLAHTLTTGHISARHGKGAANNPFALGEFLQTDAAINQGNSGGPLCDAQGRVIGIVSYIESVSGGYEGLGFAVTSDTVRALLLEGGDFWSGVDGLPVGRRLARAVNYPLDYGVLIQRVAEESPAAAAGIRGGDLPVQVGKERFLLGGDIVVEVAGVALKSESDAQKVRDAVVGAAPGATIPVKIYRAGAFLDIQVRKP